MTALAFADVRAISRQECERGLAPPVLLTVDEWADRHRYVSPEASATPGWWRTAFVPYTREIMRALTDPDVHHIVLVKAAQVAGTEIINNWCGHTIDCAPGPMLVVQPTDNMLEVWSKDRLAPMLRDCPTLVGKVRDGTRRRESDNTIRRKVFPGGYIAAVSAKSTAQMRSRPVGRIAVDERDEQDFDVGSQGDPVALLQSRTSTFFDWKILEVSTPLDFYGSRIWPAYLDSDRRLYHVPCPFCNAAQPLVWRDGEGTEENPEGGDRYRLICERDARGDVIPESARYQCAACDRLIEERWKPSMLEAGRWVPQYPGRAVRGYRLGGLYSPTFSWARLMGEFLKAKETQAALKVFVNNRLGLPFKEEGASLEPHYLQDRAEAYGDDVDVPSGVGVLTAFADLQVDWIEVGIWGYGAGEQSWVVRQVQLEGEPARDEVWGKLSELLEHGWRHAHGRRLRIAALGIDSGYQPDRAHAFALRHHRSDRPVIATIGRDGRGRPILTAPERAVKYKRGRGSRPVAHVIGTDSAKDLLAQRLRIGAPGPGYIHFPDHLDPVFFDQLTAEEVKTVYVRGHPTRRWVLKPGRRNEALDCAVGAYAALLKLGPGVRQRLAQLAEFHAQPPEAGGAPPLLARARRVRSRGVE
jgi:phage terminase large subunit GpA-like protein